VHVAQVQSPTTVLEASRERADAIDFCRRQSLDDLHGPPNQTSNSVNMSAPAVSNRKPTEDPLLAVLEPAVKVGAFSGKCSPSPYSSSMVM